MLFTTRANFGLLNSGLLLAPAGRGQSGQHHAVAGVVIPDDMLIRVVILTDDRKLLHVEAALLEFANSVLGLVVRFEDSDHAVLIGYDLVPDLQIRTWKRVTLSACLCPWVGAASISPVADPPAHCPVAGGPAVRPGVDAAAAPAIDSLAAWQPHWDPAWEPRTSSAERGPSRVR